MAREDVETDVETIAALRARLRRSDAELAELHAKFAEAGNPESGADSEALERLANTLQWDDAPRALRAVLPFARALRRVSVQFGAAPEGAGAGAAPTGTAAPPPARRSFSKRVMLRIYRLLRPVILPVARRVYPLLGRLLEREGIISQREAVRMPAAPQATAELLRSIEAAMLTIALQRRGHGP